MPLSQNQSFTPNSAPFENFTDSIPVFPTITQALRDKIDISLSNASIIAENSVGANSSASTALIDTNNGFLVYILFVADANNRIHRVAVDAGNGKVLSSEVVSDTDLMLIPPTQLPTEDQGISNEDQETLDETNPEFS